MTSGQTALLQRQRVMGGTVFGVRNFDRNIHFKVTQLKL